MLALSECVFCAMVADRTRVPHWIAESSRALAFLSLEPVSTGHSIVIPKRHFTDLSDVPGAEWNSVSELALRVARLLRRKLGTHEEYLYTGSWSRPGRKFPRLPLHVVPRGPDTIPRFDERWNPPLRPSVSKLELVSLARRTRSARSRASSGSASA
jgi:histidine triad (HIT) family protein